MEALRVECLNVTASGRRVVRHTSLSLSSGELHVLLGPNGAGKSMLANAVMGRWDLSVDGGIFLEGEDITGLPTHERARRGLTMAHQNPPVLEGVRVAELLRRVAPGHGEIERVLGSLGLGKEFLSRWYMEGMSGGERKKLELARVVLMKPKVAILDEPDSGVDVDSLKLVADAIRSLAASGTAVLVISHQPGFVRQLNPTRVHVMVGGVVVASGGPSILDEPVEHGYSRLAKQEVRSC
jgi:Fe-S cluster assembly ATP-binding protein